MGIFFRWDIGVRFEYDYGIDFNESIYTEYSDMILVQNHVYEELAVKPLLAYSGEMGENTRLSPKRDFLDLTSYTMIVDSPPFYEFVSAILAEYRFFFLKCVKSYK